ncbi:MAG: aldo/keto reductase [Deltaproteobacteria bacterium]|nr:aldo/keto reductase [Deltaproteobacteria bacterium]
MPADWNHVTLGETGFRVSPLGLGSSYGVGTADVERAFERGINFFLWGSLRRARFGRAIARIEQSGRRQKIVVAIQTYARAATLVAPSVEIALRRLGTDYVDLLGLALWNRPPPRRILDAALRLVDSGKVRHLMISCHDRPTFERYVEEPAYGALMVRYNAAHTGAERDVFPHLVKRRPGVIAFTATRWGTLLEARWNEGGPRPVRASDCYRFALASSHVDVCLAGPSNGRELDEAMEALDRGPMSTEEIEWMRRVGERAHASGKGSPLRSLGRFRKAL